METEQLIPIQQFCTHHKVEFSFIDALQELGLIELTTIEEARFVHKEKLNEIEKMMRLHYELEINMEGVDAICHLLQKVRSLQEELILLKNRLGRYENG